MFDENVNLSLEQSQDIEIQLRMFRQLRTTEITEEEIAEWKTIYQGVEKPTPEDYTQDVESITWREILGCTGPAYRSPILTDEITQQEINEWGMEYEKFKKMDLAKIKKKYNVKFERENEDEWLGIRPEPGLKDMFSWVDGDVNFFSNRETYGSDK